MNKIALLNDAFRKTLSGSKVFLTAGVNELPDMVKAAAIQRVATFDEFNEDNDPYGTSAVAERAGKRKRSSLPGRQATSARPHVSTVAARRGRRRTQPRH